ncbi:MAG: carbon storage regulator [Pirellulaceae bacterium]
MLVLSRKIQQEIVIGENVRITVLQIKGNTVRIGIDAPREVRVVRGELPAKEDEGISEVCEFTLRFNAAEDSSANQDIVPFKLKSTPSSTGKDESYAVDSDDQKSVATQNRVLEILSQLTKQPR